MFNEHFFPGICGEKGIIICKKSRNMEKKRKNSEYRGALLPVGGEGGGNSILYKELRHIIITGFESRLTLQG
jgi:hypothetical protein